MQLRTRRSTRFTESFFFTPVIATGVTIYIPKSPFNSSVHAGKDRQRMWVVMVLPLSTEAIADLAAAVDKEVGQDLQY